MKKKVLLIITTLLAALTAGCGRKTEITDMPKSVSMVLGVNENFPEIKFNSEVISNSVYEAAYSYSSISAIIADGKPFVGSDFSIKRPDKRVDNDKRKMIANDNTKQILAQMSELIPKEPEVDLLTAISLSSDMLHSRGGGSELHMKVIASGLCTAGVLNMTEQNIFEASPDGLIEELKEIHALPDLTGIHVTWIGYGQVAGKQEVINSDYKFKLKTIWEVILKEAGAASVVFDVAPLADTTCSLSLPRCSVVPIVEASINIDNITKESMPEILKWDGNSKITFQPDQAVFVDKNSAVEELKPVSDYLKVNPEEKVSIFGMTATTNGESLGTELSLQRAEAVKSILVSAGVDEERICCIGLGQKSNPLRVKDVDGNGMQIEEMAKKNRAVYLIKSDSEMLQILNECGGLMR